MEEVCTCTNCKGQKFVIYDYKLECCGCGRVVKFTENGKAMDLVELVKNPQKE